MNYGQENRAFAEKVGVAPDILGAATVVLELPPSQAHRQDARAAFVLSANLLVRLFDRLHLVAPDVTMGPHPWHIQTTHSVGPTLDALTEGTVIWGAPALADVAIGIGGPPTVPARRTVAVGFGRGVATIDRVATSTEEDVLAALIASCFGASQAFLHAAAAAGAQLTPNEPFEFGLPVRGLDDKVDIGLVHLAGVGAIGCAALYGLAHLPCRGHLVPTDDDLVDTTNLHRYVLMRREDVGRHKTAIAQSALSQSGIAVDPYVGSYQKYLATAPTRRVALLVSAVDSEAGRRHLAASLPRQVVNASTTDRYVTISRHQFADGRACLHCLYAPAAGSKTTEHRIAEDLGVGVIEVERMMAENTPVDATFVGRVERHRGATEGAYATWIGKPIQSFHQRAVCGTAPIATRQGTIVAPLGFISAAAGLLLLAELIGGCSRRDETSRSNYLRLDMLGSPEHADRDVRIPDPNQRCICSDEDYIQVYRQRYGIGVAAS